VKLRSAQVYWAPDSPVADIITMNPERLPRESLLLLISELDRRFMQLWDKVQFERRQRESEAQTVKDEGSESSSIRTA
jgi:hypothetical protein